MDLAAEIRERLKRARDIAAKAEAESRGLTDDERTEITGLVNAAADFRKQQERTVEDAALKGRIDELDAAGVGEDIDEGAAAALNAKALANTRVGFDPRRRGKTMGEQFVTHDHFRRFMQQYPAGVPESAKGLHMAPVPVAEGMKALVQGSGSALVYPEFYPEIPQWWPPMVMRQLVTGGTTESDLIEYASVDSYTINAAPVAEATDLTTGLKPESAITFKRVSAPVRTIAHWVPITRRALSDAAQVRTYVDEFLSQGLDQAFEAQMISGDGTGENFSGILHTTGVQAQTFDTDMPSSIRKAMTKITKLGGTVTGVLMDPEADEEFDLLKDTIGRYFGAGPFGTGPNTIWGRPRVVSYKMAPNQAIVGDFRTCVLWDRQQASIQLADQHADFFIRNIVALLAEARAAFGILKPQLLCVVNLTA